MRNWRGENPLKVLMETVEPNSQQMHVASEMPALWRSKADGYLGGAMEALLLSAVCGSPWFLGSVGTTPRLFLYAGLLGLLAMWAGRMLLQGGIAWQKCPVTIVLALLFLSGIWQLVPLPAALLGFVAPGTSTVVDQLLPRQPELLRDHSWKPVSAAGARISLNPEATRTEIMELLAVLLLFALVRNNIPAEPGMVRLSLCALANGVLLVLFALLPWIPPLGQVHEVFFAEEGAFGSFLSREHFAFTIEICLGLGMGVFLGRLRARAVGPRFHLLTVALGVGVASLLGGLALVLSVGGGLAVAVAALLVWLVLLPNFRLRGALAIVLFFGAVGLSASLGWDAWTPQFSRWTSILVQAREFPLWGTGYGTFSQVAANQGLTTETDLPSFGCTPSAFQVMLVEGGAARLVLSLLIIGLTLRLGIQALRRHENVASVVGLALGGLFAIIALVVHSAFESGLQVPAVSLLACVACAYLCGMAQGDTKENAEPENGKRLVWRFRGMAAPVGALVLLVLGVILLGQGLRADAVQRFALAAAELNQTDDRHRRSRQLQLLETAVQLAPADAHLRLKLAEAHVRLWQKKWEELQRKSRMTAMVQIVGATAMEGGYATRQSPVEGLGAWYLAMNWQEIESEKEASLEDKHLLPALQHCIEARNLCPLNPEPHLRLAALGRMFDKAEAPSVYRNRAKMIAPRDPFIFYQCGVQESESGQNELAWQSWKVSLELSDSFLSQILERSRHQMTPTQMLSRILAKRPHQLASAANYLFPDAEAARTERRPFAREILRLLHEQPNWRAKDFHLAATAYATLGRYAEGRSAFERSLTDEPQQIIWRYEFAFFLYRHGHYEEAQIELLTILQQQPRHRRAQDLLLKLKERLAN